MKKAGRVKAGGNEARDQGAPDPVLMVPPPGKIGDASDPPAAGIE